MLFLAQSLYSNVSASSAKFNCQKRNPPSKCRVKGILPVSAGKSVPRGESSSPHVQGPEGAIPLTIPLSILSLSSIHSNACCGGLFVSS